MLKSERQAVILKILQERGVVRVSELAVQLAVNPVTIRRDLAQLEAQGWLHREHGGAVLREVLPEMRPPTSLERRIAEAAVRFIRDRSVLFLGTGPLVLELIPFLTNYTHLTLITNALDVAWRVGQQRRHTLHVLGGQVAEDYTIYGDVEAFRAIRTDWVILQAGGLDAERGLTHDRREYATVARALFGLSTQVMVLAYPDRLGRAGGLFIAPAAEVDVVVTGREAANPPLWDLSELGVKIVLA